MTKEQVAERLRLAELEMQSAQLEPPGTLHANERYRAAASELAIAMSVARAMLAA